MKKTLVFLLFLYLAVIKSPAHAGNVPSSWSPKDGVNFAGVNLVWMGGASEWMVFKPGCYQPDNVTGYLQKVSQEFNLVRVCVGAAHVVDPSISSEYLQNLLHTLQTAQTNNLWFQIALWPTNVTSSCGEYENDQRDPYFVPDNKQKYIQALQKVAQLVIDHGLLPNLLYIDIRNELSGHIGGNYDSQGTVPWGELPREAEPYYQNWLQAKYSSISALNQSWWADFTSFSQVPFYRSGNANSTVESTYGQPNNVRQDQQSWIIWSYRDWVTTMAQAVHSVDPRIRVSQSTTESQSHVNIPLSDFTNTNDIFNQSQIGGLIDVFDFHSYKKSGSSDDFRAEFARLHQGWPQTIIIMGETWNENDQALAIGQGGDGIIFWDEPGTYQIWNRSHTWTNPDTWTLTTHGQKFLNQINTNKNYIYPTDHLTPSPPASSSSTPTTPHSATPTLLPSTHLSDINSDGIVDLSDYSILVTNFLVSPFPDTRADINQDGIVDVTDYSILVSSFLK